jgi:hypothetical protein
LSICGLHFPFWFSVYLITYQDKGKSCGIIRCSMLDESVFPSCKIIEAFLVSNIIN